LKGVKGKKDLSVQVVLILLAPILLEGKIEEEGVVVEKSNVRRKEQVTEIENKTKIGIKINTLKRKGSILKIMNLVCLILMISTKRMIMVSIIVE